MSDEAIKAAAQQFIKRISLPAQREIERAIRSAIAKGKLRNCESFTAMVTVSCQKVDLDTTIHNTIELDAGLSSI